MSSLTTETQEVWAIILHLPGGAVCEIDEYAYECEEGARARAHEEVSDYIAKTGEYAYCTLEHRIIPIYK